MIAGAGSEALATDIVAGSGVEALGFVDDLEALYREARVVCCPITVGGGTRIKLIEAAVRGKAIVSTAVGIEGLDFENGRHAVIRETHEEFADACIDLLINPDRAHDLGAAAREVACRRYSRARSIEIIMREIGGGT
jgi:glycosyltransferase involved in cell wall biosynthesis